MKTLVTLVFAISFAAAFADGKGCCASGGCCSGTFKAKAFDKKDAEFLALANHMAAGADAKKGGNCCSADAKHAKKAKKGHKAVKAHKTIKH